MNVSIIIPVYNEADHVLDSLDQLNNVLRNGDGNEVIVVDGGSTDGTDELVLSSGHIMLRAEKGRACQMNAAAIVSSGDVLLFLHADTQLPSNAMSQVVSTVSNNHLWGRFDVRLSSSRKIFRLIETMINLRSCFTSVATGDQAMFVSRELFNRVGGFPSIALMEDIALSKKLRRVQRAVCLKDSVITSSRRWEQKGVLKTMALMWWLRFLFSLGVSPTRIERLYR